MNGDLTFLKDFNIEPIREKDQDYKIIKNTKKHFKKHPEDFTDLEDIDWD